MKKLVLILSLIFFLANMAWAEQTKAGKKNIIHTTLEINPNPNWEMLIDHSFNNGVKVNSIKIKQVTIESDTTVIVHGEITEGPPKRIGITIEITDTKGNTTEIFSNSTLSMEDCLYHIKDPRAQ